ncbi:MAG TPA: hypothetical protein VL262_04765 [Vicinamibacterales bacterium]|jgi:hypothetical protein|nr:hypothetical protein [Vicinamibacterales bacterium]
MDDDPYEDGTVSERGYSIVELLVSTAIMLTVIGSVCEIMSPAHATAFVQAEMQDMQQRARAVADRLTHDLWLAGAGPTSGSRRGPLIRYFAPVLPRVCCGAGADAPGSVSSNRLTIAFVPRDSPEAVLSSAVAPDALRLDVAAGASCPTSVPACGFADGDVLLVFDDSGQYDVFKLDLGSGLPMLGPLTPAFDRRYAAGATVCRVVVRSYYRDIPSNQLFTADGDGAPQPVVDRIVALRFEYVDAAGTPLDVLLADGPWRGSGSMAYDADLLRVRRMRVSYTIRSGLQGTGALRIPDLTSTFDVQLRNAGDP